VLAYADAVPTLQVFERSENSFRGRVRGESCFRHHWHSLPVDALLCPWAVKDSLLHSEMAFLVPCWLRRMSLPGLREESSWERTVMRQRHWLTLSEAGKR